MMIYMECERYTNLQLHWQNSEQLKFDEWLKVGWALHACDCELLFATWMLFSTKSDKFDFLDIPSYCQCGQMNLIQNVANSQEDL